MANADTQASLAHGAITPEFFEALVTQPKVLAGLLRGVEKESLRVAPDGSLSTRPHPKALGSPLTHPAITTDFSEAQLELITTVHDSAQKCLRELTDVHRFVYSELDDELLWPSSMPCIVGEDNDIPVGQYGSSNIGRTKTIYRRGLGLRYGRLMQTISGIHYNFSLPDDLWLALGVTTQDERTAAYFGLIRNFRRWSWLLIYLFGASPAVCRSFTRNMQHTLQPFDEGSQHLPFATSLRMGPLGYQSSAQSALHISYNSLQDYTESMVDALTQNYPEYASKGIIKDGEYQQLNASVLQIENEFYGTIRPKRRVYSGERPVTALRERGVEYVEVRCLDLNPFLPVGIDDTQMNFIDTFLLLCLLSPSAPDSPAEFERVGANQQAVVEQGRDPSLKLKAADGAELNLAQWGEHLLDQCAPIAHLLDQTVADNRYVRSLSQQRQRLRDPDLTPSAQVLATMREQNIPFFRFSMNKALEQKAYFGGLPLSAQEKAFFELSVADSITAQQKIEAADELDYETFLREYLKIPSLESGVPEQT
jgi:glutamate--cysteine ligase